MVDLDKQELINIQSVVRTLLHLFQDIQMDREVVLFLVTSIEAVVVVFAFYYLLKWLYLIQHRKV